MTRTSKTFPDIAGQLDEKVVITTSKPLGLTAEVYIHEVARKLPLYNQAIDSHAEGQDKDGTAIAVNTVGRWLFGVPGYAGHSRITPTESTVAIYFSKESPKVVHDLVLQIKQTVEESN